MTVIYIDTLFLLNFIINYLLLLATAKIAGETISRLRLIVAGAVGAAYAVAVFLPGMGFLSALLCKLVVAGLMVLISFPFSRRLLRLSLVFFGISFAFAGGILAVYLLFGSGNLHNGIPYLPIDMKVLLVAGAACYLLLSLVFRRSAQHGGARRDLIRAVIRRENKTVELTALVDTGNTLTDPLSNQPVMVAELAAVRPLFSRELLSLLTEEGLRKPVNTMEDLALLGQGQHFRLIPYQSVGVECGMLLAIRADELRLGQRVQKGVLVALSPTKLSDGGAYTALAGAQQA